MLVGRRLAIGALRSAVDAALAGAGGVVLLEGEAGMGKTALASDAAAYAKARNPWDTERSTSGSSGGSAAAVASGMVPFAHGNDLGGSLRYPASACGLFALKPTRARNPLGPEYGDVAGGAAVEHALTRTVRDSAALLDATSGPALGDPYWAPPPARPFAEEVGADPGRLRIAYTARTPDGDLGHPHCAAAAEHAARLCASLGHEVTEADWPHNSKRPNHGRIACLPSTPRTRRRFCGDNPAPDLLLLNAAHREPSAGGSGTRPMLVTRMRQSGPRPAV